MEKSDVNRIYPDWLSATLASDATEGRGVLPYWIKSLQQGTRLVGSAFVILACEDDNQALRVAMASPFPPGCVLVVGGHSTSRTAVMGDLMAMELQQAGVAGLITDGLVRDSAEIRALGFPVWCRGTTPTASGKHNPGVVGGAVTIGGALVRDGDLVVADDNGVVIWAREEYNQLLAKAQIRLNSDNARLARLRSAAERGDGGN